MPYDDFVFWKFFGLEESNGFRDEIIGHCIENGKEAQTVDGNRGLMMGGIQLKTVLFRPHPAIWTVLVKQLVVSSMLEETSFIHNENVICTDDAVQTVRDRHDCPSVAQSLEGGADGGFGD